MKTLRRTLRRLIVACGLTASLATGLTAVPSSASESDFTRLTDRDDLFGWEAVGRVNVAERGFCTGVLIASDLVLTAAHCVYDSAGNPIPAGSIQFRAGLRDGISIADRAASRVVAAKSYNPNAGMSATNVRNDAALIELAEPILTSVASPFVIRAQARAGDRVSVVSYGRGRDAALSWQRDCGVLWQNQGIYAFDCNVTFGSSGAPVFYRDGTRARILSLVSGGRVEDGQAQTSYGMELPALVDELKSDLRALPRPGSDGAKFKSVGETRERSSGGAKFYSLGGS